MPVAPVAELLTRWRKDRQPALSEKLHLIGDRLTVEVPPLSLKKKGDAGRELLAGLQTAAPHQLSARLRQVEAYLKNVSAALQWPLMEALAKLPPDPRVATLAVRVLVGDLRVPQTDKLTRRLLDCIEVHGDDTHFRALELGLPLVTLSDAVAARAVKVMQQGLQRAPKGPSLPVEERKRLAATTWEEPADVAPVESLYAAVWEAPADLTRRRVLADQLLERGDPRGEFISLQLANASPKRQAQLLKAHGKEWLGALAEIVEPRRPPPTWENGFVAEVTCRFVKQAQFHLVSEAKEWATVRRVRGGLQRFSPAMASLEDAGSVKPDDLRQLLREAPKLKLRSLGVRTDGGEPLDVLAELPHPPRWFSLHARAWAPARWIRDDLGRVARLPQLERLRLSADGVTVMTGLLRELGLGWLPPTVTELQVLREHLGQLAVLRRDGRGWALEFFEFQQREIEPQLWQNFVRELEWLEPTSVSVAISHPLEEEASKLVVEAVGRFGKPVKASHLETWPPALAW